VDPDCRPRRVNSMELTPRSNDRSHSCQRLMTAAVSGDHDKLDERGPAERLLPYGSRLCMPENYPVL
jgi:hypothetical protein